MLDRKDIWLRSILRGVPIFVILYLFLISMAISFSRFGEPPLSYHILKNTAIILALSGIGMVFLARWAWFIWVLGLPIFSAAWFADVFAVEGTVKILGYLAVPLCFWIALLLPRHRVHYW